MELRVTCGKSDRKVGTTSVFRGITAEGPVFVIEVQRTRSLEWAAMWYFATEAEAEANRDRAKAFPEGKGGQVTDTRVTEGRAYWAPAGQRVKRAPKPTPSTFTSSDAMGF